MANHKGRIDKLEQVTRIGEARARPAGVRIVEDLDDLALLGKQADSRHTRGCLVVPGMAATNSAWLEIVDHQNAAIARDRAKDNFTF